MTVLREWTAAHGPLLLLLDDFDRADALSWALLARAAEEIDMALLALAAIRPSDGVFATPGAGQVLCLKSSKGGPDLVHNTYCHAKLEQAQVYMVCSAAPPGTQVKLTEAVKKA